MCNRCRINLALLIVNVNTEVFALHNQVIFGAGSENHLIVKVKKLGIDSDSL